jgi:hypothetical protein
MPASIAVKVNIIDDHGDVDQEETHIHKGEEVQWFAHGNETATIVFSSVQGSPFPAYVFQVPAGGSVSTGDIKNGVGYGSYKYSVVAPNGVTDPEVIIVR